MRRCNACDNAAEPGDPAASVTAAFASKASCVFTPVMAAMISGSVAYPHNSPIRSRCPRSGPGAGRSTATLRRTSVSRLNACSRWLPTPTSDSVPAPVQEKLLEAPL